MFSSQHWQIKLVYAGFGGFLMLTGMLFSPVTALRDRKFGDIECTSLTVVDADGGEGLLLNVSEYGGRIFVGGNDGVSSAFLTINENGGHVLVQGNDGKSGVFLSGMDKSGGGGAVSVLSSDGKHGVALGGMDKSGSGGWVSVQGKDGKVVVMLRTNDHGGVVSSHSKDRQSSAVIGINEHGAYGKAKGVGAEFVWDKHGYRQ